MHCIAAWHLSYVLVQFEEQSSFLSGHYHDAIIENMIMEVFEIDFRPHTCGRGQVGYHYSEQSSVADIALFSGAWRTWLCEGVASKHAIIKGPVGTPPSHIFMRQVS